MLVWYPLSPALATPQSRILLSVLPRLFNGKFGSLYLHIQDPHYQARGRARDGKCLITDLETQTYSRLKVAHIFSRAHDREVRLFFIYHELQVHEYRYQWIRKGYPSKITDTVDVSTMGGTTKIDSVQNVITLRSDLHNAWNNYEFGVDPNVSFVQGYRSGLTLRRTTIALLPLPMVMQTSMADISSWIISKIQLFARLMSCSSTTLCRVC